MARRQKQPPPGDPEVRAAGGVVVREEDGEPKVAAIHRPRYMDWSLPKGKLEPGESWERAAMREVEEETGYRCQLGRELDSVAYLDRNGRKKVVRYWEMSSPEGDFEPDEEVDELRWVDLDGAKELLDYDHDLELVAGVLGGAEAGA
jgi:8-oxo-dGTP pyrophosphatase MutT (NUDIX family)